MLCRLLNDASAREAAEGTAAMIDGSGCNMPCGAENRTRTCRRHLQSYVDMQLTINGPKQ